MSLFLEYNTFSYSFKVSKTHSQFWAEKHLSSQKRKIAYCESETLWDMHVYIFWSSLISIHMVNLKN